MPVIMFLRDSDKLRCLMMLARALLAFVSLHMATTCMKILQKYKQIKCCLTR